MERPEYGLELVMWNAGPAIEHADAHCASVALRPQLDHAGTAITLRIRQQVAEQPAQRHWSRGHRARFRRNRKAHAGLAGARGELLEHLPLVWPGLDGSGLQTDVTSARQLRAILDERELQPFDGRRRIDFLRCRARAVDLRGEALPLGQLIKAPGGGEQRPLFAKAIQGSPVDPLPEGLVGPDDPPCLRMISIPRSISRSFAARSSLSQSPSETLRPNSRATWGTWSSPRSTE